MKKMDFFLLIAIVILALVFSLWHFLMPQAQTPMAVVYVDGEKIMEIDLSIDKEYHLFGASFEFNLICENGTIRMEETPCPNQVCVNTGAIKRSNSSIVCVPNRVSITIKDSSPGVNTVAY